MSLRRRSRVTVPLLLAALVASWLAVNTPGTPHAQAAPGIRVAVVGNPSGGASWNADVRAKLLSTGEFSGVDVIDTSATTPTLGQLQQYPAVLVFTDCCTGPPDPQQLGNVLADYVDAGGRAAIATFSYTIRLGGRIVTGGYLPFTTGGGQTQGRRSTLAPDVAGSPLLAGVGSFDGGTSSFHEVVSLAAGATLVAHWTVDGVPLVGFKDRVVGLNFYPVSSDAWAGLWDATTDGGRLMANALLFGVPATHTTALAYTGPAGGDHHDAVMLSAVLDDTSGPNPVPVAGRTVSFTLAGTETCTATTAADGTASCAVTPAEPSGDYTVTVGYPGDSAYDAAHATAPFHVAAEETALAYAVPAVVPNGGALELSAVLTERTTSPGDASAPIGGRPVTMTLGTSPNAQSCTGTTDTSGTARCTIAAVDQPLGPVDASAAFAGDAFYEAATATEDPLVFAYLTGGTFVVGDRDTAVGSTVQFWGDRWARGNSLSGGRAPREFKGFAPLTSTTPPSCPGTWSTGPADGHRQDGEDVHNGSDAPDSGHDGGSGGGNGGGNDGRAGPPRGPLPSFLAVAVTSSATRVDDITSGDIVSIVVVATDSGYRPDPGHPGTGRVVAVVCG